MNVLVRTASVALVFLLVVATEELLLEPAAGPWVWSGAVTERSAVIKARLTGDANRIRVAVSEREDLAAPRLFPAAVARQRPDRIVSASLSDLEPDTRYFYAIERDGSIDRSTQGSFRTFPIGPASFRFAFGSCAVTGSEHGVFLAIRDEDPLFFVNLGDLHYENIDSDDPARFRAAYDAVLTSRTQSSLYRQVPVVYVWDDHDYGKNNSDRASASRSAAWSAYRRYVPHYPLPAARPEAPIYQAFRAGRVYFIMTDSRSERSPIDAPDDERKTLLGAQQKEWLKRELSGAAARYPLVIWLQPTPWIGTGKSGVDPWWSYSTERRELANFVVDHGIRNLLMLSGDAHMLAIDDGRHNRYADDRSAGFPVFHAGPLDRHPAAKGGPYSEGVSTTRGQYGLVEIVDTGRAPITVRLAGKTADGATVVSHAFTVPEGPTRLAGGRNTLRPRAKIERARLR